MNWMKRSVLVSFLLVLGACTATTDIAESTVTPTREAVAAVEPTAIPAAVQPTVTPVQPPEPTAIAVPTVTPLPATPEPTATPAPTPVPTLAAIADQDHSGLAGSRGLTLQWISWEPEDWGTIMFVPLIDGTYAVDGTQTGPDGDFVSVNGVVTRVGDRELQFSGEIVVQVSYTNDGQPCVRSGDFVFLATGDRRFWRMQDLLNCDGIVTDYVDIYFG